MTIIYLETVLGDEKSRMAHVLPRRDFEQMCGKPPTRHAAPDGGSDPNHKGKFDSILVTMAPVSILLLLLLLLYRQIDVTNNNITVMIKVSTKIPEVRTGRADNSGIIIVVIPMLTVQRVAHRTLQKMMLVSLAIYVTKYLRSCASAKVRVRHSPRPVP